MARRTFLAQLSTWPFPGMGHHGGGLEEVAEDHDEKCVGAR
jgi:hypothetical protein